MLNLKNLTNIYHIGKSVILRRPRIILADLTYKCNSDCVFCSADKSRKNILSLDEWKDLLDQIKNWLGSVFIDFSGGEPLLNKDWFKILKYSVDIGLITSLSSNGSLISKSVAKRIMSLNLNSVYVSLHGNRKTHNALMRRNNQQEIISGVKHLISFRDASSNKTTVFARVILHNKNMLQMDEIIDIVKNEGFDGVIFRPLIFDDSLIRKYSKNDLWVKDNDMYCESIQKIILLKKSGFNVLNSYNNLNLMKNYYVYDSNKIPAKKSFCSIPFKRLKISCNGDINVCCHRLGNIKRNNLRNLFLSNVGKLIKLSKKCQKIGLIGSEESTTLYVKLFKAFKLVFR